MRPCGRPRDPHARDRSRERQRREHALARCVDITARVGDVWIAWVDYVRWMHDGVEPPAWKCIRAHLDSATLERDHRTATMHFCTLHESGVGPWVLWERDGVPYPPPYWGEPKRPAGCCS